MNMKKRIFTFAAILFATAMGATSLYANPKVQPETEETFAHIPQALKQARWLWPYPASWYDIHNSYALFRQTFELGKMPEKAILYISADQQYMLYINGKYVNRGPARAMHEHYSYDEIDVLQYLKTGKNLIAIRAYNSGKSTFSYVHQANAGVIFALETDGKTKTVSCMPKTKCIRENANYRDSVSQSLQLNYQEHFDMNKAEIGWQSLDYDDSNWGKAEGDRAYNAMPYYNLQARGTPMCDTNIIKNFTILAKAKGKTLTESDTFRNICELYDLEKTNGFKKAENAPKINVAKNPMGEFTSHIVDFGKTVVGTPILKIENASGGEIVDMVLSEKIDENFNIDNLYKTHSKPAVSNRLICKKGLNEHEFFSICGFRYMEIRVRKNNNSEISITPSLRWSNYPLGSNGVFECSDKLANEIWKASVHTQRCCAMDGYVDTPYREQAQWWGDARVQSWNTFFISGDARLLRRGINILSQQTLPNGLTYGHAPTMAHTCILPDFSLVWILTLYDHYWQTGSAEAYTTHRDTVMGILNYFNGQFDTNGLLKYDKRYWLFLDWSPIQKQGNPAVYNLLYLYTMQKMQQLCEENGFKDDAKMFAERALKHETAIILNLLGQNGLIHDGILPDKTLNKKCGIHAQTLAKMCNINGFNFEKALNEILLPFVREKTPVREYNAKRDKPVPSSFWVIYLLQVLDEQGKYAKDIYDFYMRNWDIMAEYGGTFEGYPITSSSRSHAWTAHPAFMLPRIIGGVRQTSAGWKSVSFKPATFIDNATIVYPTPNGKIRVDIENGKAKLSLPDAITLDK